MQEINSPVLQAIFQRRSIRSFTPDPVSRDALVTILEAARWAPSGKNRQPWRFQVLLQGDERKNAVAGISKYTSILNSAAALIVVVADKEACYYPIKDQQSVGACLQNMLLAAHSLGLGALWLGESMDRKDEVLAALNIDADRMDYMATVAVGHPAEEGRAPKRHLLDDLLLEPF